MIVCRENPAAGVRPSTLHGEICPTRRYNGPALADTNTQSADHLEKGRGSHTGDRAADLLASLLVVFVLAWYWLPAAATQGSTPHDQLFYFGVLPLVLLASWWAPWRALLGNPLVAAALAFIGYLALSSVWSREPTELGVPTVVLFGLSTAAFLLASAVLLTPRRFAVFRLAVVAAATTTAIVAIIRLVQGHGYPLDRLCSPVHFEHPNLFAHYLGFAAVLAIGAALKSDTIWRRWTWLGSTTVLTVAVLLTRSRTATAALLVCLLVSVGLHLGRRSAAVLALALIASGAMMSVVMDKDLNAFVLRSDAGRDVIYRGLVERLGGDWVFGAGIVADDDIVFERGSEDFPRGFTVRHPHSAVVGTFYYGGIVGLALLGILVVTAIRRAVEIGRPSGVWDPLVLLVFGLICLLTDGHRLVSNPHLSSWLLLWFPVGLIASYMGRVDPVKRPPAAEPRATENLGIIASGPLTTAAILVVATMSVVLWASTPMDLEFGAWWISVLLSAIGLALLLAKSLGPGAAGLATALYISTTIFLHPEYPLTPDLLGLAVMMVGTRFWLEGLDRQHAGMRWIGGAAMAGAGLLSPAVALTLGPPVWWWTRKYNSSTLPLLPIAATWLVGWAVFHASISQPLMPGGGLQPVFFGLALWLSLAHIVATRVIGLAGVVPAVAGVLLATSPERRWLLWWLIGSGAGLLLLMDPSAPGGRELISLAAPAATAITLGVLWLGRELAQIDFTGDIEAPVELDERRRGMARRLVIVLMLVILTTRLWPVATPDAPVQLRPTGHVDSSIVGE